METFALFGLKGGARRTTSSLMLAAGLCEFGFYPLHIQILAANRPPVLSGVADVPFETAWVEVGGDTSAVMAIRRCVSDYPQCCPVVVDMPAGLRADLVADPDIRILLPMGDGVIEIESAARDYLDAAQELERHWSRGSRPPAWFLPAGWPSSLRAEDYASILGRFGLAKDKQPFPVILPAIAKLDPLEIDLSFSGDCFELSPIIEDTAVTLARAVLVGTCSPLLPVASAHESRRQLMGHHPEDR